ncbi:hypothetical protein GCM10025787_24210 [Saccharopolyspora rosea]
MIGGGPAGLSAALVLGRQRRRVLVADGGQVRNAPADEMHMYLSRDGFSPHELLALGRAELAAYPGVELRQDQVASVSGDIDDFTVEFADGTRERARRLVLATGQVDEPYDIPGVPERFGRSIFHCPFCHGWEATGKTLAVLGRDVPQVMLGLYLADRHSDDVVVVTHGAHELPDEVIAKLAARGVQVRTESLAKATGELDALQLHFADGSVLKRQARPRPGRGRRCPQSARRASVRPVRTQPRGNRRLRNSASPAPRTGAGTEPPVRLGKRTPATPPSRRLPPAFG